MLYKRNKIGFFNIDCRFFLLIFIGCVLVFWKENGSKRELRLLIDVAFVIHGSKNITSPERKKTYKEAIKWAKKIVKAFGDIGENKTRAALVIYATQPKLMFNFTQKLTTSEVNSALDEAGMPPELGNHTFTGKALTLTLNELVNGTRKEAVKKFFVFSDRPPDDDPLSVAEAIKEKNVDLFGLGTSTAPYNDWYIPDYGADSMYTMMAAGPFKGSGSGQNHANPFHSPSQKTVSTVDETTKTSMEQNEIIGVEKKPEIMGTAVKRPIERNDRVTNKLREHNKSKTATQSSDTEFHKTLTHITASLNQIKEPTNTKINPVVTVTKTTHLNKEKNPSEILMHDSGHRNMSHPPSFTNTIIAGVISQKLTHTSGTIIPRNDYGSDPSIVVTSDSDKSTSAVGRYSTKIDNPHEITDFGTVIGGVRHKGAQDYTVIKPDGGNSNQRSNIHNLRSNKPYKSIKKKKLL